MVDAAGVKEVTFDSETYLIIPGLLAPPLVATGFKVRGEDRVEILLKDEACDRLEWHLDAGDVLIGHNVTYDFGVACAHWPSLIPKVFKAYREGRVRDSLIRQKLIDIAAGLSRRNGQILALRNKEWVKAGYSLSDLERLYLSRDRSHEKESEDAWRKRYHELDGVPVAQWPVDARQYVEEDVAGTEAVVLAQGRGSSALLVNEVEQNFKAWALHLVSCWGMRSDAKAVEALDKSTAAKWKEVQDRLYAEGFYKLQALTPSEIKEGRQPDAYTGEVLTPTGKVSSKSNSPAKYVKNTGLIKHRVEKALVVLGVEVPKTPTNETKIDADTLAQTEDPLLMELGESGPIGTIRRTFLPTLQLGTVVPINTQFNTLLETGRISASQPNTNNLPREGGVRECIVPRPGFVLCSVDYDCAELRSLAQACLWLCGYSELARFFQKDPEGDPHLELAASMLGISSEEAKRLKKLKDPEILEARQAAKAYNFGLPGGLGIKKFVQMARKNYGVILTEGEAAQRKEQWFSRWPEMRAYFRIISQTVGPGGAQVMQLRPGKKPHRRRGEVGYCDGANGYFQGLTADGAAEALCDVSEECYVDKGTALYGSRVLAFLYDEIITEVPADIAHEAAFRQRDVMVAAMRRWTPDVPASAEPALMERWSKKAKAEFKDGRLQVWRDAA